MDPDPHAWREHLDLANTTRLRVGELRRGLMREPDALEDVLADPAIAHYPVGRVIAWLPGWGSYRGEALLSSITPPISWNRACGQLTARQRRLLGEATRPR